MRKSLPLLVLAGFVLLATAKSHHYKKDQEDYDTLTYRTRVPRAHEKRIGRGDHHKYEGFKEEDDDPDAFENPELHPHHKKHRKGHHGI